MKRISLVLSAAVVLAIAQSLLAQATAPATGPATGPAMVVRPVNSAPAVVTAADVPVTRIILFSSGVGYFEHNGAVNGNVTADLRFETAQINDVLKSLVVFDRGGGHVTTITYPANDPVNRTLRSFEVNLSGDPSMAEILKQIRGAQVSVNVADEVVKGTILGIETKQLPVGKGDGEKILTVSVANIITDSGIRSISLDDIRKLEILDEKIKKEMNQALAALVQARDQSKKTVTVHFDGTGKRDVGMGYLVEIPVWKTSYRLILPDAKSANNAELQAWAIVENQTDNDWQDVSLSLVGGRPISYIELLYQPLYMSRPVVSPTVIGSIVPQTYDNGFTLGQATPGVQVVNNRVVGQSQMGFNNDNNRFNQFANGITNSINGNMGVQVAAAGDVTGTPMSDFTQGVAAIAEATRIGEMFHYMVDKVSLPRQTSSMIPIVAEGVKFDRVSIYSPTISVKYAMRGVRMYNGTGKYLLGGPVTVMDSVKEGHSYAGDAKIEDIPPGQSRLLSYALDQEALIQVARDQGDEALLTGSVVKGTLWLKYRSQVIREYTLQNKGESEKTIILEHPVNDGYALKEPEKALEKTDKVYRFEIKLAARESKTFKVVLERTREERMTLVNMQNDPLFAYMQQGVIPARVRDALQTVAAKRGVIADVERKINKATADRAQVLQEQANIRENIKVLPAGLSQDAQVKKLTARDADLENVNQDLKTLNVSLEAARADLAKYLDTTSVE